ncbi:YkgJ family cysteine cluster protein [Larsenimonas rhizosphaerae]|uniref:YkgJ family cysteine cluster protein n=1 Tax=Larsenimonas rhizosphaerae TaxID=2944682 RepID=A0AA41ZIJ7_9GAMM|nr:YkgJ family cysteine cluster protein [Larsenimonas rhizosphaerae]MCM2131250.1 YkgJ family cysteine cluster protein [Larsenimonas rhizosphaerae]MCX2525391.1 YkgJ family cysteine cluster protein [Larsenimonas rhizosphaerae]
MPATPDPHDTTAPQEVSCFNCEACCCRLEVLLDSDDLARNIPHHLVEEDAWGGLVMRQEEDGWCAAVDRNTMLCTIHSRRPQNCRDFDIGSFECLEERAIHLVPAQH